MKRADLPLCPCGGIPSRGVLDPGPNNDYRKWVECPECGLKTDVYLCSDAYDRPADIPWCRMVADALRAENAALREEVETLRAFKEEMQNHPLFGSPSKALIEDDVDGNKTTRTINGFFGGHKGELIPEGEIACNFLDCYGGDGLAGFGFCEIEGCEPRNPACPARIPICPFCHGEGLDSAPGAPLHEIKERLTWQPIESAPRDGTQILIYELGAKPEIWISFFSGSTFGWYKDDPTSFRKAQPTHWMPLPEPPKE